LIVEPSAVPPGASIEAQRGCERYQALPAYGQSRCLLRAHPSTINWKPCLFSFCWRAPAAGLAGMPQTRQLAVGTVQGTLAATGTLQRPAWPIQTTALDRDPPIRKAAFARTLLSP